MSIIVEEIKRVMQEHEPPPSVQWYVDEHCIDCDAEEFWKVLEEVI